MCSELDPWTNGSQLSQLDLKSTRAFQPYVCLKLPLSCEHCYFPKLASFHIGLPRELIPLWSSQIKKENSSQVSVGWGSLTMVVKLMWTRLYMPVAPFQSPGRKESLTSFEFKLPPQSYLKQPGTIWLSLSITFCFFLPTARWVLCFGFLQYSLFFNTDESLWKVFLTPQSSWRCWKVWYYQIFCIPSLLLGELIKTHRIWGGGGREPWGLKSWL